MSFRVQLDRYHGPLDLLLYLVRKEELEISQVPVARVTEQFLEFAAVLERLEIDEIGDYLELAAQLIELKSRVVLPQHEEIEKEEVDPHEDLVQRLLEFKKYRDAAAKLSELDEQQSRRFARQANDLPAVRRDPLDQPLESVELWDLVSAFTRVLRENLAPPEATNIRYDETPVHVHMERVYQRVGESNELLFSEMFPERVHKSKLVSVFLAVLELVRRGYVLAEQSADFGDILLRPGPTPYQPGSAEGHPPVTSG